MPDPQYDHVHDRPGISPPLEPFAYLVGHFRGTGRTPEAPGEFLKEVRGDWIARGRFLALDMTATYPMVSGDDDVHEAFVVLGVRGDELFARAFADSGEEHTFEIAADGARLVFPDRLPACMQDKADRARKTIEATPAGYREILEVEANGAYSVFSTVEFARVAD